MLNTQFENTKQNRRYHKDPQLHLCSNHRWEMIFKTSLVLFSLHIKESYVHVICNASCWRMEIQSDLLWVLSSGHSSNSRSRQDETRYHRCPNHRDTCSSGLKTKIVITETLSHESQNTIYAYIYLSGFAKTWLKKFQVHILTIWHLSRKVTSWVKSPEIITSFSQHESNHEA